MKKLLLALSLMTTAIAFAQPQNKGAEITFEKEMYDFGQVRFGANTTYEFKFKNTGDAPLIISNAKGSCNCTVPSWPKDPIAPGASAEITVKYNSNYAGPIAKSVTITSNASNEPVKVIRIKGNVEAAPENPGAVNQSGPANH